MIKPQILLILLIISADLNGSILNDFNHFNAASYGTAESLLAVKGEINNLGISPASLAGIRKNSAAFSYIRWLELVNLYHLGYGMNFENTGTAGISIDAVSLNINNYLSDAVQNNVLQNREYQIGLGFARNFNNLSLGADLKYLSLSINGHTGSWIGTGFNGIYQMNFPGINIKKTDDNILLTAGLQNISLKDPVLDKKNSDYPMLLLTGINYDFWQFSNYTVGFSSAYKQTFKYADSTWSMGTMIRYQKIIFLRMGLYLLGQEFNTITMGLGIQQQISNDKILSFDYCLMPGEEDLNHCAGIKLDF